MYYILERLLLVHYFFLVNYQPLDQFYYTSIVPHTHITFNGTNFTPLWMKLICWKEYFLLVKKKLFLISIFPPILGPQGDLGTSR